LNNIFIGRRGRTRAKPKEKCFQKLSDLALKVLEKQERI
jgi:hypothetical protein